MYRPICPGGGVRFDSSAIVFEGGVGRAHHALRQHEEKEGRGLRGGEERSAHLGLTAIQELDKLVQRCPAVTQHYLEHHLCRVAVDASLSRVLVGGLCKIKCEFVHRFQRLGKGKQHGRETRRHCKRACSYSGPCVSTASTKGACVCVGVCVAGGMLALF